MFIVIEGTDSSGKKTQTELLINRLKNAGKDVEKVDFPAYETPFGEMVARYLRGEFGSLKTVAPEVANLLYTIDRYQFRDKMVEKLKKGKILVANRYLESNIAFQGAKFEGDEKRRFIQWIKECESRLPQSDVVVFLDMPIDAAASLMDKREKKDYLKGKGKDIHEEDKKYQERVRETYLEEGRANGWVIVNCAEKKSNVWRVKSIEDIHAEIWERTKNFF
ncbi:dTMP kinase [Candidatus Micrarchaeota archaeon]|nr:dTMP kinase [Candidatus Micrarchaeota archaeon]